MERPVEEVGYEFNEMPGRVSTPQGVVLISVDLERERGGRVRHANM